MRGRPLRALPARARSSSAATGRCSPSSACARAFGCGRSDGRRASRRSPSGSSRPATAASSACSTARTSCSPLAGRSRSPTSWRRGARPSRGRTTCRSSRARSRRREDAERIQRGAAMSRRLVTIGACATAGGIQALRNFADVDEFVVGGLRDARSTSRRSTTSTPISAHVHGRLRAARLPDQQAPAAGGDQRLPERAQAADPGAQRLHRVQAARHRVRDGRPRHALPGPGHARRLRRDLPGLRPRLLRLLRPDGDARTRRR